MKLLLFLSIIMLSGSAVSQNLQLHYDFRHTADPGLNPRNFTSCSFEYFKDIDTIGTGSFLLKLDVRFDGSNNNTGQAFTQISQSLKFWKRRIYLSVNYSGGLGVTPESFGFYIANSYGLGVSLPFQWKGAWFAAATSVRYNAFEKPSYDPQFIFYFSKGFFNYKIFTAGSFVFWTQNRDQGNEFTADLSGKKIAFFGDPQLWIRIRAGFSAGSKANVYYNLLTGKEEIKFYPTLGLKYEF